MPRSLVRFLLVCSLALPLGGWCAPVPASLKVVLDDNYPPYAFRNERGEIQGILKDLWALWSARTGIAVDFQPMPWAQAREVMEQGGADVIDTIFETEARRQIYEFSTPYARIEVPLFFHETIGGINDAASAKGFTIGVKAGDACIEYLTRQGLSDFRSYPSYETLVQAALGKEVRVLCIDKPPAMYFFNREKQRDHFRYSAPLYVGELHWAVAKGKLDLKETVAAGFARISPEERENIEHRWLGRPLGDDALSRYTRPLAYALAALCLAVALLFLWGWLLRRRVAARTQALTATLASLQASQARFRALFEQANDAILIFQDGRVTDCNRRAETLYRLPRERLLGLSVTEQLLVQPDGRSSAQAIEAFAARCRDEDSVVFEWRSLLHDGTVLDLEIGLSRIDGEGAECRQAIVRDIGERKRQESRIRELLDEQKLIFDNTHVGIMLLRNRQVLKCNRGILEMFGFEDPAEIEGQSTRIFYPSDEAFEAAGREGYSRMAADGFANFELEMRRRDGGAIWVIQTGRPLDRSAVLDAPSIWAYTDITERKRNELALRQSRRIVASAFESSPVSASIATAEEGRFIETNANYERDFGWRREELIGRTALEVGLWENLEARQTWVARLLAEGRLVDYETRWRTRRGEVREVSLSSEVVELDGVVCTLTYVTDITQRKQSEARLRIAAAAFESQEGMMVTDARGVILQVNQAFSASTGYDADEVVGKTPTMFKSGRHDAAFYRQMWASIRETGSWQGEIWDRRKNGEIYPKWLTISAVTDESGEVTHYVGTHFDITERKRAEERIQALAFYDQLTGLANRVSLHERLGMVLGMAARSGGRLALLMIDLDNFKSINDTLGHQLGDSLLQEIAFRLTATVRQSDLVARLGGDEFIVVLSEIDAPSDAACVAEKILSAVARPCLLDGHDLRTSASIGICLYPGDATDSAELIKKADVAMYHAKSGGRSNYQFFREEIQQAAVRRLAIEADLRKAIERHEFQLHYQPQLELKRGCLVGVEALIRWQHPEKGMVSPLEFIPIAEESGLILPIGDWVLEEACRQLAEWQRRGIAGIRMSVNLTASQFLDRALPDRILALLRQFGLDTALLNLEVTESMSMASPEQTIASMRELTDCGMSLSIDDFGTGYSSLAYLKMFPVSTLKIDRSFVKDIETDRNDADICDVTVQLAHKLGMDVVAEGVETQAQLDYLRAIGCEKVQGYLISRPLPADAAERFILDYPVAGA